MQPYEPPNPEISKKSARANRLSALRSQLRSQLPSGFRNGMAQARTWLQENPEDDEIYSLLLGVASENPGQQDEIYNVFSGCAQKGSTAAANALLELEKLRVKNTSGFPQGPTKEINPNDFKPDLMSDADDAYYAAEFEKAIRLYRQVLQSDPENQRARQQLDKAEINRIARNTKTGFPREAMQYYRRARSHIAARDIHSAIGMLNAAIEEAQAYEMKFPEAEDLLMNQQDLLTALEFVEKADKAIQDGEWDNGLDLFTRALRLDPQDQDSKDMRSKLEGLLETEALLDSLGDDLSSNAERQEKLEKVAAAIRSGDGIRKIANTPKFKEIRARSSLYKAASDLENVSPFVRAVSPQFKLLKNALNAAEKILKKDDQAIQYAKHLLKQIRPFRIGCLLTIIFLIIIAGSMVWQPITALFSPTPQSPSLPALTLTATITPTWTQTPVLTATVTPMITLTDTPIIQPTETIVLITAQVTPFTIGYVDNPIVHPVDRPNGIWVGELKRNQVVKIFKKEIVSNDAWYFCEWELNNVTKQGWILAKYIKPGNPPQITPGP